MFKKFLGDEVMKKMTKAMLMTALILGAVQMGGTPVHASELDTFTLDEYVVTATRTPVKVFDANANISVVTREEIENAHYETLEDALRTTPGIQTLNYGNKASGASGFRINGATNVGGATHFRRAGYHDGFVIGDHVFW